MTSRVFAKCFVFSSHTPDAGWTKKDILETILIDDCYNVQEYYGSLNESNNSNYFVLNDVYVFKCANRNVRNHWIDCIIETKHEMNNNMFNYHVNNSVWRTSSGIWYSVDQRMKTSQVVNHTNGHLTNLIKQSIRYLNNHNNGFAELSNELRQDG